ncbi:MAG TPA: hypothetical protein DEP69_05720 [Acidimicrobiaceae bacterium]|nr:hypothetical protein [Acidimicrobiaceae bacterium]
MSPDRRRPDHRQPDDRPGAGSTRRVGVRELRSQLTTYLRSAEAGHRIAVTVNGVAVAELGPVGGGGHASSLEALAAVGLIEPPRRPGAGGALDHSPIVLPAGVTCAAALAELRGGRPRRPGPPRTRPPPSRPPRTRPR